MPNQIGMATYHFNAKAGKIDVLVAVHGNWADTAPIKEVQNALKSEAQGIILNIKFHMREVSDSDVDVLFTKINLRKQEIVNGFVSTRTGNLPSRNKLPRYSGQPCPCRGCPFAYD